MNANSPGTLYQEVCLVAGETIGWTFAHRARLGGGNPQVALLEIADDTSGALIQSLATQSSAVGDPVERKHEQCHRFWHHRHETRPTSNNEPRQLRQFY